MPLIESEVPLIESEVPLIDDFSLVGLYEGFEERVGVQAGKAVRVLVNPSSGMHVAWLDDAIERQQGLKRAAECLRSIGVKSSAPYAPFHC